MEELYVIYRGFDIERIRNHARMQFTGERYPVSQTIRRRVLSKCATRNAQTESPMKNATEQVFRNGCQASHFKFENMAPGDNRFAL